MCIPNPEDHRLVLDVHNYYRYKRQIQTTDYTDIDEMEIIDKR